MTARVRVESPDQPAFERDLDAQEVIVGRAATAGLVLPDSSVSRQHVRLFQKDGRWWAEDLGATNGTLINDKPLTKATPLEPGDALKLGSSLVRFVPAAPAPMPTVIPPAGDAAVVATGKSEIPGAATADAPGAAPERELALAHEMQMALLPRRMPDRPEIRMAASLTPAGSPGGNLYDFVVDDEGVWFIVADVSGRGVAAVICMAVVRALFRAMVQTQTDLAAILRVMNRELSRDNEQKMFVTAISGRLAFDSGQIVAVNAGHEPALIVGPRGDVSAAKIEKSVALGVAPEATFNVSGAKLDPGSTLLIYTDGATKARNTAGEIFGAERLQKAIGASLAHSATDLVHSTLKAVNKFAAGAPPEDDLTLLAIEYLGTEVTHR